MCEQNAVSCWKFTTVAHDNNNNNDNNESRGQKLFGANTSATTKRVRNNFRYVPRSQSIHRGIHSRQVAKKFGHKNR